MTAGNWWNSAADGPKTGIRGEQHDFDHGVTARRSQPPDRFNSDAQDRFPVLHTQLVPSCATLCVRRFLSCDPFVDELLQHIQRDRALAEDDVVELAEVERAELFLGPPAQLLDLQLADLVGQGLAGPGDVAVDLVDDVVLGLGGVRP